MSQRGARLKGIQAVVLVAAIGVAVVCSRSADWEPFPLFFGLLMVAIASDALALRVGRLYISGSFAAIVLAMAMLGPTPAVAVGVTTVAFGAVRARLNARLALANLTAYAVFPLVGGLIVRWLEPDMSAGLGFAALVFGVFVITCLLNFTLIHGEHVISDGVGWWDGVRTILVPVLPVEVATGLLTGGVVIVEEKAGPTAIVLLAIVVLVFQYLLRTAREASDRGVELEERNRQLAALHIGLISTLLKTLSLRDHMTARHSAAVARYSREMAKALGLNEEDQELIHTAALFHDVGKFIFPDVILLGNRPLNDEEFEIVRRHPGVGADLVSEIEGYGPVAHVIRHHHERIDGHGYPNGIVGDAIPLGSRIIAVADTYDVITARDTYRSPVTLAEAFAELRRSAGTQLDAEIVEVFISLVEERGIRFRHSTAADFEEELGLERRVRDYAAPRAA